MPDSRNPIRTLQRQETLNFWLTNRIPRRFLTRAVGAFSRIRSPRLARISIRIWQWFADDLRLDEAEADRFDSLHACFTRRLKAGARPVEHSPGLLTSPCDAVIGAHGRIEHDQLFQAKGMAYRLTDLLGETERAALHRDGYFVTLRLKSSMYHRFHAPCAGSVSTLRYISGDVYNVNPPTLKRIPGLFCRNERAVLPIEPDAPLVGPVTLVPVAAVLVSSMRFTFLDGADHPTRGRTTTTTLFTSFERGDELGWFEHGSTIIVVAPGTFALDPALCAGDIVRMGRPLLRPEDAQTSDG